MFDGPLSGGVPKGIELYVINNIADLSIYGVGSANNGGGTDGEEFTFPAVSATAGDFIYVASESTGFTTFFGFAPDYTTGSMAINGDDAIELFESGSLIDLYGDQNVDGTGEVWDHADGWAYRNCSAVPNCGTFIDSNWTFSGTNALDGEVANATAVTPVPVGTYATVCSSTGCTDPTACNFDSQANVDDGSCLIPVADCSQCNGAALEIIDTDGDGICNADDNDDDGDGVADPTDNDPLDPFVCLDLDNDGCDDCSSGTFDPANDGADTDGDGICDAGEVSGCTNVLACNYDATATDDDGSCLVPVANCSQCNGAALEIIDTDGDGICDADDKGIDAMIVEQVDASIAEAGAIAYRVYIDLAENYQLQAVYGNDANPLVINTSSSWYNDAFGSDRGDLLNDALLDATPSLAFDSYVSMNGSSVSTIGVQASEDLDGTADGRTTGSVATTTLVGASQISDAFLPGSNTTDNVNIAGIVGGSYATTDDNSGGTASNSILVGQFTTTGDIVIQLNVQIRNLISGEIEKYVSTTSVPALGEEFCPDLIFIQNLGCTDPTACNFDSQANVDDGSCLIPVADCSQCNGAALEIIDTDGDGICNADDNDDDGDGVADPTDNDPLDPFVCLDLDNDGCDDCSSGTFDPANDGTDTDGDGICDAGEVSGCTNPVACNYDPAATDDNGTCLIPVANCSECDGSSLVTIDTDNDGICDADDKGIDDMIVEQVDASTAEAGAIAYRVYIDLAENYQLQAVYGNDANPLVINTSSSWYNDAFGSDRGDLLNDALLDATPSLAFDSYVSMNGSSVSTIGVQASEDLDGTADGRTTGSVATTTFVGASQISDAFLPGSNTTDNVNITGVVGGSWATTDDNSGGTASNSVLVGQFTTTGDILIQLNIQVRNLITGEIEKYVSTAGNAATGEEFCPELIFSQNLGCTDPAACNYDPDATVDDGSCIIPEVDTCPLDLDDSGTVDVSDFLTVLGQFGAACPPDPIDPPCPPVNNCPTDFNDDNITDITDYLQILGALGFDCP